MTSRGFTVVELTIAMALTLAIMAAALALAQPAQAAFRLQLEEVDMSQRLRAAVDSLTRDILRAGSGLPPGLAAVVPYDAGASGGGLTVRYAPSEGGVTVAHSYYVRRDGANPSELRRSDGTTDVPVVDHVASVAFSCFDDRAAVVPSCADAQRIRRVRIALRVEGSGVPDRSVVVDVAPRALRDGG